MIGSTIFFNHLQITVPNGPFQFDIPELLQSKFMAVPVKKWYDLPKLPSKKMVPKVSRSVHARFTVIVGLLLVVVGLLPVIVGL